MRNGSTVAQVASLQAQLLEERGRSAESSQLVSDHGTRHTGEVLIDT